MSGLPGGTVTFLFTDIEGSTRLWTEHPEAMKAALARHDALLAEGIQRHGGILVKSRGEGDSLFAVFPRATDAVAAACDLQRALLAETWPTSAPIRVRMAIHTGEADLRDGDYYGPAVNRCARLRAIGHGGQVLLSLATEELVRDALPAGASLTDLGLHGLQDLSHPEHVFQLVHPELPAGFPPLRSLEAFPNNLPRQLTSFIGRERELAEVKRLLESTSLLTLTGVGGCGKTRLALQAAADFVDEYPDGVWWVELAVLSDGSRLPQAIAAALGVREEPQRSLLDTVVSYLRSRQLLLVLDNCEHLVAACAQMVEALLRACPRLRILATSREALNIPGETSWPVPSLTLPEPHSVPALERLTQYEAVRLFIDRAISSRPGFRVNPQNAPAVAQICHRLDGIPLAIELAAARIRVMSVEQIAARLDDRFRLLTGGSRTALPRQQTLRALIDWSYDLLSEPERALLRRLAVFAGGWTLEAAEAVCADDEADCGTAGRALASPGDPAAGAATPPPARVPKAVAARPGPVPRWQVLDLLSQLVDKSLVVVKVSADGETRYHLLETVRQYSQDRLFESGEAQWARGRHVAYYLHLAEQAEAALWGPEQQAGLARLEAEHDNLRWALQWCEAASCSICGMHPTKAALRLAGALWWFWNVHGHLSEGREWLAQVLAPTRSQRTYYRVKALNGAAALAWRQADFPRAQALAEEALALAEELGSVNGRAVAIGVLGLVARQRADYARARALCAESLDLFRQLNNRWGTALMLAILGQIDLHQGEQTRARARCEEALSLFRQTGDLWGIGFSLHSLAIGAWLHGQHEQARALQAESRQLLEAIGDRGTLLYSLDLLGRIEQDDGNLEQGIALHTQSRNLSLELGDRIGVATSTLRLGTAARRQGNLPLAAAHYRESLALFRELNDRWGVAWALLGLGNLARDQGDAAAARAHYREGLELAYELGDQGAIARCLEGLAWLASDTGDPERAARLFGAADARRAALDSPLPPVELPLYRQIVGRVRDALGESAFRAAWEAGRALPLAEAVRLAFSA